MKIEHSKRQRIILFAAIVCGIGLGAKTYQDYRNNVNDFEIQNVEALAMNMECSAGGGIVIAHWCSKKPGDIRCGSRTPNRKWVRDITLSIGYSPSSCYDCEDDDYEYVSD